MTSDTPKLTRLQKWLVAVTVFVVLGYAWMSARMMEPRLLLPTSIDNAVWFEAGKLRSLRTLSQMGSSHFRDWARVFAQAKLLSSEVAILGRFEIPVQLIINTENRGVYAVSDRRIEIGLDVAASDGQLLKAVIKAWLFQNAAPAVQSSQLRMEVASDVVLGAVRGSFRLERPDGTELRPPFINNWLKFAASFENSCGDVWLPIELASFCGSSDRLNPLTLRPLLTAMVLESFQGISPFERMTYLKYWVEKLKVEPKIKIDPPKSLSEWRGWVRAEALAFLHLEPSTAESILERAGLGEDLALQVDFILKMDSWKTESDVQNAKLLALVTDGKSFYINPAGLPVSEDDFEAISSPMSVRSGCNGETVREALNEPIKTKQILYLPCPDRRVAFSGMAKGGVQIFMRENPQVAFVQFNRSALERAYGMNILRRSALLDGFLRSRKTSPLLGLEQAEWNNRFRAFRVVGAVETVGWFRLQTKPRSFGLTTEGF